MKKMLTHYLVAGALAATCAFASPAMAQAVACGVYQPGMLAFLTRTRPAPCSYQGDYLVNQGPTYSGPAVIAPQPTYSPSPTVGGYVHGSYRVARASVARHTVARRIGSGKGKVEIVRARAEVRIYGPERMDIRLYRR
jgi:hypothetical protein